MKPAELRFAAGGLDDGPRRVARGREHVSALLPSGPAGQCNHSTHIGVIFAQRRIMPMSEIRERMKVVDKHGAEVGIVDEVEGDRIKLEQGSDNQHHYVDKQLVAEVVGSTVKLSVEAKEVKRR
jgi:hypothetical protein